MEALLVARLEAVEKVAGLERISPKGGSFGQYFDDANQMLQAYGLDDCVVR